MAHHIMQGTKILSTYNGTEKQDEPENSMRAPRKAGAGMEAHTDSQSFPDDGAASDSICSSGEDFVRSPDLEHHAKRYQHKQVYHCALHGCGFSSYRKFNLRVHHYACHGFVPSKEASPKPKKGNTRAEKAERVLESCVQKKGDELVEVLSRNIFEWESGSSTSDDNVAQVSGQPRKGGTAFMAKLHSMLRDRSIELIILVSNHNDGFVNMWQYFRFTSISSFIRLLDLHGIHQVGSDLTFPDDRTETTYRKSMRAHGELKTRQVVTSADPDCTERFSTREYRKAEVGVQSERKFSQARKRWTRFSQIKVETEAGGTEGPASVDCAQVARPQERKSPSLNARQSSSPESIEDNPQYPYPTESNNASEFDIASIGAVSIDRKPSLGSGYCSPKDLSNPRPDFGSSHASFKRASPKRKKVKMSEANAAVEYTQTLEKNTGSLARRQACDRCRVWKMCCDDHLNGCAPCIQTQVECKTTDQVTGEATVRSYVYSLECQLQKLRTRNRELEARFVSLGQDAKPYTDDDDTPLLPWCGSFDDLPTAVISSPTTEKPIHSSNLSHNNHGEAVLHVDTSADQSLHREAASITLEDYSDRAEDSHNMLRQPPEATPKFLRHRPHGNLASSPRSRYRGESSPAVAVPVRGVIKTVELAYWEAEKLLCWITDTQTGFTALLKNSLRHNAEKLEAAIKVREEGYGRQIWFNLEDGIATEALNFLLVYFQDRVLGSLRSIRDSDSKVDLRNLIDASNFARMESIAVLDESSLRLAQAATVAKRLVKGKPPQLTPEGPAYENCATELGNGPRQSTARVVQMPSEEKVLLPLLVNAPSVPERSGFVGSLPSQMLEPYTGDFCRGAYNLRKGWQSESLRFRTRIASKTGRSYYWTCTTQDCAFEGPACRVGEQWTFDNTVRKYQCVRYRWSFLVKCHQNTETVSKKEQHSFMCILCIPENLPLLKYQSEDNFMKHVASHAGQRFDWFIEQNVNFICGRTALQGEAFDSNFPSPIRDIGPASSAAPLQRMAHMNLVPVTTLKTDATAPVINQGSDKDCQRSRSETGKSFDKDGHVIIESNNWRYERRALVDEHLSLCDTRDAGKAYQMPQGKPRTTTNTGQPSSRGRLVGRKFPFIPFSSSSDTSSIYSGNTYDSSTYGSKDDSSMTSGEESQMETQPSINDAEHFAMLRNLQGNARFDCKSDSATRIASLQPLDSYEDSDSRVVASSPHFQESSTRYSGPETILPHQLSSNPEDLQAASDIPLSDQIMNYEEESLTKEDIAASGRTSSQPEIGIIFHPKPVYKEDSEIEQLDDALEQGKTDTNDYSDSQPIAASDALSSEPGNGANELNERLEEDSKVYNSHPPQSLGKHLAEDSTGSYPIVQPTKDMKLPKHAEEIQYHANDEKLYLRIDTNDNDAVIQMSKSATQYRGHDKLGRTVRVPSWDFIFKQVFPLTVLVGTHFIRLYEAKYHNSKDHNQTMNEKHNIYLTSVQMVAWMAVLYSMSKLLASRLVMLASPYRQERNNEIGDPTLRLSKSLRILNGQEYSIFNSAKLYIEHSTEKQWDWWPFVASFRPLQPDEVRVEWECETRHTHWFEIPKEKVHLMIAPLGATIPVEAAVPSSALTFAGHRATSNSSSSSQISHSRSSDGRSSPATSDTGCSSPPSDNAECDDDGLSEQEKDPSGDVVAVDIVSPSKLNGYVLFGVQGSKRLRSSKTRLTQIDLSVCKDDDSFFDEMKVQYKELRGYLRWIFSIWVFHTCEFIMFFKANPNEIMSGPEEMPSVTDMDYRFATDRYPPILSSVFNASFYGCNKACIKSRVDVMSIFHECKGRNHCGKYRILERLPKRCRKWDIDRDEEKDEAWGLHATFGVSFYKVVVYHLLILAGPTTFWGVWLRRWPTDWQNASVPFFAVVVLLSLFWLPFVQKVGSKEKVKHKMA